MSDGVIFDMDGVLVASGPAHHASWRMVARRHGIEISAELFKSLFGRPSRDIIRAIWGERVTGDELRALDEEKERCYRELITGMVPLMIGCRETLQRLAAAGFILAVATSGPRENLELVLRETGIGQHFRATVTGFDITHGKPAPDCFLLAAERAGLSPQRCIVVEDAPVGVQAGVAAGMTVIGLEGTHRADPLREAGAAHVVTRLAEITPELVAPLQSGGRNS
jgi:beta-phosphoglucomutase